MILSFEHIFKFKVNESFCVNSLESETKTGAIV